MQKNEKILYCVWGALFIICAGLGTITERSAIGTILLTSLSIVFFVPGGLLLYQGIHTGDKKLLFRVRMIALISLLLTMVLIVANTLAVFAGETLGKLLNDMLLVLSAPMFCCHWHGVSLFLWACVFIGSFPWVWKSLETGK
jgi:hypothetical protein